MFQLIDSNGKILAKSTSEKLTDGLLSSLNKRSEAGLKNSPRWTSELTNIVTNLTSRDKTIKPENLTVILQEGKDTLHPAYKIEVKYPVFLSIVNSPVLFTRLMVNTPQEGKQRGAKRKEIEIEYGVTEVTPPKRRGRKPAQS